MLEAFIGPDYGCRQAVLVTGSDGSDDTLSRDGEAPYRYLCIGYHARSDRWDERPDALEGRSYVNYPTGWPVGVTARRK